MRIGVALLVANLAFGLGGWASGQTQATSPNPAPTTPEEIFASDLKFAKDGYTQAAYQVGIFYMQGRWVKQDLAQAEHWFEIGATHPEEKRQVAYEHLSGQYFKPDTRLAIKWYESAGDSTSMFNVARIYQLGQGIPVDLPKAIAIYLKLLKLDGDPYVRRAEFELGNLVIDGQYTSGDPVIDLRWARIITQELIGQEQYKLAFTTRGSAMDLPSTPEVAAQVVRSAAAYDVDLGEWQMSKREGVSNAEAYAWLTLAGRNQIRFRDDAAHLTDAMTAAEMAEALEGVQALNRTRQEDGAYYLLDDPLRTPDFTELETDVGLRSDPDRQLRLAYHYELEAKNPAAFKKAMVLYRTVRNDRVADVRLKIGNEYLLGRDGYPKEPAIAAQWYGFAVKAGSAEACRQLGEMRREGLVQTTPDCPK